MPSKTCSKCGETEELIEFSKNNYSKDGLRSECKSCFWANQMKSDFTQEEFNQRVLVLARSINRREEVENAFII